jgi:hypothetical protein
MSEKTKGIIYLSTFQEGNLKKQNKASNYRKMCGELFDVFELVGFTLFDCLDARLSREQIVVKVRGAFHIIEKQTKKWDPLYKRES